MMDTKANAPVHVSPAAPAKVDYSALHTMLLVRDKLIASTPILPNAPKLPYLLAHVERDLIALDVGAKAEVEAWKKSDAEAAAKKADADAKAKAEADAAHAKINEDAAKAKAKVDEDAAAKLKNS